VGKAAELIDLTRHTGAHPRLGAADVVPFIPLEGFSIEDCVALARRVGREIWERYRVPVYFYEAAATRPERTNLESIRKGQFEGVREEVMRNPDRAPDVGEPRLHPTAGAVVVGARKFLIAYNINLDTPDKSIADKIARAIRFSSGGLRYVKAMGVDLKARGLAQVSINLTDFEQTPMHRVFELVRSEAARYGCHIVGSEIVGLIPKRALELASEHFLQLENFSTAQIMENRLAAALSGVPAASELSTGKLARLAQPLLDAVAAPSPTPGGGSVAALAAALAASLGEMVAGLSRKKKSLAANADALSEAISELRATGARLAAAADRDADSYDAIVAASKLPKETREQQTGRDAAVQHATRVAAEVPLEVAEAAVALYERLVQLEPITAPSMISDLRVARAMALAGARGALENVAINLASINDAEFVGRTQRKAAALEYQVSRYLAASVPEQSGAPMGGIR
jgi:glutamate formiminotransferase / formiminotetrahydrofolate cyclodeaminase